jgi:diguanylate cyclase (GGDEF)-like protein
MATHLVRRDLLALLERERLRNPHGRVPALALVEIDRFPELSNLHGRATADHMMQQLAELVRGLVREHDLVERFYDDLIALVLPQLDDSAAQRLCEAIRATIERHDLDPGGLRVTASIGLAFTEADVLDETRNNLRRAKLLGGNRVVFWDGDASHQLRGHKVVPWPDEAIHQMPPHLAHSPRAQRACLVVIHGEGLGRKHDLERGETTIGRDPASNICVSHESVSRTHATITFDDTGVKICDNGSTRGTYVHDGNVVARCGGDELVVLLPEINLRGAAKLGETVRETVEQASFVFEDQPISLTISLGVAELEPHTASADDLVRIAEARMIRAKALGRNRVVSSDE